MRGTGAGRIWTLTLMILEPMVLTTALHYWNQVKMKLEAPENSCQRKETLDNWNDSGIERRWSGGTSWQHRPYKLENCLVGRGLAKNLPQGEKFLTFAKGHYISNYATVYLLYHHSWFLILVFTWQIILQVIHLFCLK